MATDKDFIDYIAEQSQLGSALIFKKMFGEYGVYLDSKVIAFVCDNSLFVKSTEATRDVLDALPQRPPYPGAKPYPVADELLDDADTLKSLLVRTADGLPAPKVKKRSTSLKRNRE
jgi:TfoX/Sxy family transcriptional regulator of competence genes